MQRGLYCTFTRHSFFNAGADALSIDFLFVLAVTYCCKDSLVKPRVPDSVLKIFSVSNVDSAVGQAAWAIASYTPQTIRDVGSIGPSYLCTANTVGLGALVEIEGLLVLFLLPRESKPLVFYVKLSRKGGVAHNCVA